MSVKVPRISGAQLRVARIAAETPASSVLVRNFLKRTLGVEKLGQIPESLRADLPLDYRPIRARTEQRQPAGEKPLPSPSPNGGPWPRRAADYVAAYVAKRTTPREVAERALVQLSRFAEQKPTMNVLASSDAERTRADAAASTQRYADGQPLGPLDGVPFLVKDQHDVAGLPTTLGAPTGQKPADRDATIVARLRDAGAVFIGKTVLTEWGLSPLGANVHFQMPHNPFDPTRAAGGSSTGSAVGVALGLCPIATGGDGGGSIRVPASLNGIFGMKPTFGRVSRAGDGFRESVAALGPLGASTADLALFLDAVATGADPRDEQTERAPAPPNGGFLASARGEVRGISIGIDEDEWRDAAPDIQAAGQAALRALERKGVDLRKVKVPLAPHAARIGYVSIGCEGIAYQRENWLHHRGTMGEDLRLALAALSGITALEYLDAQRLRRALGLEVADVLRTVDVLALPCTAGPAPRYDERDAGGPFSDPVALDSLCRFAFLANLTGLPAASAPVGVDAAGLPMGLQLVGDAWAEATLLALLAELEREEVARVVRPPSGVDLLG
jgi:Asp-tRNA(Asn)/Glu-tRNA(Gln) amidotransferase A subunit family amidase